MRRGGAKVQGQIWAEVDCPRRRAEKAGPAENVMVKEVWGTNALVEWQPPKDDGNSEVTGYFVQKADKKTMVRGRGGVRATESHVSVSDLGLRKYGDRQGSWCLVQRVRCSPARRASPDSGLSLWHLIWSPGTSSILSGAHPGASPSPHFPIFLLLLLPM